MSGWVESLFGSFGVGFKRPLWAKLAGSDRASFGIFDALQRPLSLVNSDMRRDQVLLAVDVVIACINGGAEQVAALQQAGFSAPDARIIADTLSEAFALPAMEHLGVIVDLQASAKNRVGVWVQVSLADCEFFAGALELAREHRAHGILPQRTYLAIAERSSQVKTVSKALNAGTDVTGAQLSIALIGAFAEDFDARR